MGWHNAWAWIIVAVVLLILFGGKKLPEAARGLGRSMRIFKSEMDEMKNEEASKSASAEAAPAEVTDKPLDVQTVESDTNRKSA